MSKIILIKSLGSKKIDKQLINRCLENFKVENQKLYKYAMTVDKQSKVGIGKIEFNKNDKIKKYKNIHTVFNGNIYNFLDLKKKLKINKQISNEELIASGYQKFGNDFFKKIEGPFVCILYNNKNKNILVFRDKFGTNLLFYYKSKDYLIIFSEIKLIKNITKLNLKPNIKKIINYLVTNYRYVYGDNKTFFNNISLFPTNSVTLFKGRKKHVSRLNIIKENKEIKLSDVDAVSNFHKLLDNSFKQRFDGLNKNCAFLLSGGLDSPTVVALATQRSKKKINAFSICYKKNTKNSKELFYDESKYINKIIKANKKINWNPVYPDSKNFPKIFDEMLERHDEPISSPTWFSHYTLCKYLKSKKIKYVFGGDGGDHILAGLYDDFPYYFADLHIERKKKLLNRELKKWEKLHDHPVFKKDRKIWQIYKKKCFNFNKPGQINGYSWDEEKMRNQNIYKDIILNKKYIKNIKSIKFPSHSNRFLISKIIQDLLYTSSPPSSRAEDINFSSFGLSCRSILLDSNLVNFCWKLPGNMMIREGYTKWLMRHSMKNLLPKKVLWRKEHVGLNAPANTWFRNDLKDTLHKSINSDLWDKVKIFDKKKILKIFEEHQLKKKDHMMFLWKVYSLEKWIKHWKFF